MKLGVRGGLLGRVIFAAREETGSPVPLSRAKARPLQRLAAVKAQGGVALFENAKPLQHAEFFR